MDQLQWRFVFICPREESSTYSLVVPELREATSEIVHLDYSTTVTDKYQIENNRPPPGAPNVSLTINQRNGQINVCIGPNAHRDQVLARTPAQIRIEQHPQDPPLANLHEIVRIQPPKPISRSQLPSPAGVVIRTPKGNDFAPIGSIRTPGNTVWTPKGSSYSPGGTAYWPFGSESTNGNILTPAGTVYTPSGIGYGLNGHIYTPHGTTYSPSGVARTTWAGEFPYQRVIKAPEFNSMPKVIPKSAPSIRDPVSTEGLWSDLHAQTEPLSPGPQLPIPELPQPPPTPHIITPVFPPTHFSRRPVASPQLAEITETTPAFNTASVDSVIHSSQIPSISPIYPQIGPFDTKQNPIISSKTMYYWPPEPPERITDGRNPARSFSRAGTILVPKFHDLEFQGSREDVFTPVEIV